MPPTIAVQIPSALRHRCRGASQVEVCAATVLEALETLRVSHPEVYRSVCDETGAVRPHVNLFVNDDFLHDRQGLATALRTGDVLTIMPAVSGG